MLQQYSSFDGQQRFPNDLVSIHIASAEGCFLAVRQEPALFTFVYIHEVWLVIHEERREQRCISQVLCGSVFSVDFQRLLGQAISILKTRVLFDENTRVRCDNIKRERKKEKKW